jgi:lipoate-protein ligase B
MFEVINGKSTKTGHCSVNADNVTTKFNDFVMVGMSDDGSVKMMANADPITLAVAIELITAQFKKQFSDATPEQQKLILEAVQ